MPSPFPGMDRSPTMSEVSIHKNEFSQEGKMMATLTLELPPEAYHRLHEEANPLGKPPQVVAQEWFSERLSVGKPASCL